MLFARPDHIREPLYVVTPIFNPIRFRSRWKLYQEFAKRVVDAGAVLYTIEAAFGERAFALADIAPHKAMAVTQSAAMNEELAPNCVHDVPSRGAHRYLRVRSREELWLKENLINLAVARLPADWKYVAFVDADITFLRPDWVGETIQQLQHYAFLQMFSHAMDIDATYRVRADRDGFVFNYHAGGTLPAGYDSAAAPAAKGAWSGLAWAATREAWDAVGGLVDYAIHGGGDWHMAFALVGAVERSVRRDLHPNYLAALQRWQTLAERLIRRNVGFMHGTVMHYHHGPKRLRHYSDRHSLLAATAFDPLTDLKRDAQGLWQLVDDGSERFLLLRDGLRWYARQRNEDDPNS
jgi:hypothetical protein